MDSSGLPWWLSGYSILLPMKETPKTPSTSSSRASLGLRPTTSGSPSPAAASTPPGAPADAPQPRQRHAVATEHQPEGQHEGGQGLQAQVGSGVGGRRVAQLAHMVRPEVTVSYKIH